jgi:2-polyprenyl-3-methyl-5-hydroxy-6-metoxy-1,4-benzoquinol methylase
MKKPHNIDLKTVESFGDEWGRFDQTGMSEKEAKKVFDGYFSIFNWSNLPKNSIGFDMGCGSGRWAKWVAPKVTKLHCIDPSNALEIAKKNLISHDNILYHKSSVDSVDIEDSSQDFGYSLGVLHHIPDTAAAIKSCARLLKPNAPMLLYLYYAFDNRSLLFKFIWQASNILRGLIHPLPPGLKHFITDVIALFIYWPLAKFSKIVTKIGFPSDNIPLSFYQDHSLYTMRTDARDRFGTPLEQRFSKDQIAFMMEEAGFINIQFSNNEPYWCVIGYKNQ